MNPHHDTRNGFFAALGAFFIWGLLPLYIHRLAPTPPVQIMAHRVIWAAVFVFAYLAATRRLGAVGGVFGNGAMLGRLAASAALISINWLVYVWAVANGHVIEASLGYFINPLVSVLMGVFVLNERLNRTQWLAVALASAGVLWLTVQHGTPPWIALALALSFGSYGLIRKQVAVDSIAGLGVETLLIAPLMLAYLIFVTAHGTLAFGVNGAMVDTLLVLSGAVTAVPLVLFAYGVRRIPLTTVGILQYVGPTLQFLTGRYLFHEAFSATQAVGFVLIWAALIVYVGEGFWRQRRARLTAPLAEAGAPAPEKPG